MSGKLVLNGWILRDHEVQISLYDIDGTGLDYSSMSVNRPDVSASFPEIVEEQVYGFKLVADAPKGNEFRFCMSSDDKNFEEVRKIKESGFIKTWGKTSRLVKKAFIFWRENGVRATLKRIKQRLTEPRKIDYNNWRLDHIPSENDLEEQRQCTFIIQPKFSIVIPLYKTPLEYLDELVKSIQDQTYSNWEICFSDGSGKDSPLREVLESYELQDDRIKVVNVGEQLQISENTNEALKIATGDFIAFSDHDDILALDALYECVVAINRHPEIELIYSDEDKVSMDGKQYSDPHFKPDYNKDLLNSTNYFCHLLVVKKDIVDQVGGFDPEYDGAQDYDFVLRCTEATDKIYHIPNVLYHWRTHLESTAENPESKEYAFEAGMRAVQAHYNRVGLTNTNVTKTKVPGIYRTIYTLKSEPMISIIIPNKDHIEDLKKCLESIEKQEYANYEIIVVENNSTKEETFEYYKEIESNERINVVFWDGEFNFSAINNYGVRQSTGDYLLFLNNDTEMIRKDCLKELLGFCMREDVGAVGARLYYSDDSIQHAGVIVGLGGIAGHAFLNTPSELPGYFGRIISQQDYSAVTAACVMTKRKIFEEIDGFDETLKVAFNDVDFCMKIREKGYLIVYNPYAELYHYESKSRGAEDTPEKQERFESEVHRFAVKWPEILKNGDPYYNPNLTLIQGDFSLRADGEQANI